MTPWGFVFSFSRCALHFTESVVVRVNEFLNTISKANANILHSVSSFKSCTKRRARPEGQKCSINLKHGRMLELAPALAPLLCYRA